MVHWKTLVPKDRPFLGHWDLFDKGDVKVVVAGVGMEMVFDKKENTKVPKLALSLKNTKKKFIINDTNANTLVAILKSKGVSRANDADTWKGCEMYIYHTTCKVKGVLEDCIRVRPPNYKPPTDSKKASQ